MLIKRKQIKPKNYYIQLGCFIIHLSVIIYMIIRLKPSQFFPHLTNWSFFISSVYLFVLIISDTVFFCFSKDNLEKFNYMFRNNFSKIAFPYNFLICISFWIILLIGIIAPVETFMEKGQEISFEEVCIHTYVHLILTIFLMIELFLNEREIIQFNWFSIIVNSIIFIIYCISLLIEKYVFEFYPYLFMKNINVLEIVITCIIIYGLLIGCIFIYNHVSNLINKKNMKNKESGEKNEFIDSAMDKDEKEDFGISEEV